MPRNSSFKFKQFEIRQEKSAMKVGVDGVLLGSWVNPPMTGRILDVGTGTGLLALMLAQKSNAFIDAIEIDKIASEEATENVFASKWSEQINVIHSSFVEFAEKTEIKYDLIISNPPFYNENTKEISKGRNLARNQNSLHLNILIESSGQLLSPDGKLVFIYPFEKLDEIAKHIGEQNLYIDRLMKVRPNPNKKFHRVLVEASTQEEYVAESELIIEKEKHLDYTEEFIKLTRDYYLNF